MSEARTIHRGPGEGETFDNPIGGPVKFLARAKETNGELTAFEATPEAGEGPPLHVHTNASEIVYVLEGTLRFKLNDEVQNAPAGTFVYIPEGAPHTWQNIGDGAARLLIVFTPAAMESFFEGFAEAAEKTSVPEGFRSLGGEAGMEAAGPPLAESDPL